MKLDTLKNSGMDFGKLGVSGLLLLYVINVLGPKLDKLVDTQAQIHTDLVIYNNQQNEILQILGKRNRISINNIPNDSTFVCR